MTERNVKKQLLREAEDLLDSKKESLTAFYQPTEQKRTRTFRARRTVLAAVSAVLVAAVLLAVPALQNADPSVSNETSAESSATAPSEGESEDDEWWNESEGGVMLGDDGSFSGIRHMNAAVVEITGIMDETLSIGSMMTFVKMKYKLLYHHGSANPFLQEEVILVIEQDAKALSVGDVIFFEVESIGYEEKSGIGPFFDLESGTEYLRLKDGRLSFTDDDLISRSFHKFHVFNSRIQWYEKDSEQRGKENTHPVYNHNHLFENGMTIEEIKAYFERIECLYSEYYQPLNKTSGGVTIY